MAIWAVRPCSERAMSIASESVSAASQPKQSQPPRVAEPSDRLVRGEAAVDGVAEMGLGLCDHSASQAGARVELDEQLVDR